MIVFYLILNMSHINSFTVCKKKKKKSTKYGEIFLRALKLELIDDQLQQRMNDIYMLKEFYKIILEHAGEQTEETTQ